MNLTYLLIDVGVPKVCTTKLNILCYTKTNFWPTTTVLAKFVVIKIIKPNLN